MVGGGYSRRVADEAPPCLPAGRPLASSWKPRPAVTTRRSSVHQYTPMWLLAPRVDYCTRVYTSTGKWPAPAYTKPGPQAAAKPTRQWAAHQEGASVDQLARHWTTHGCRPFMHFQCLGFLISRCKNLHWCNAHQTPLTLQFPSIGWVPRCNTETRSGVYVLPVY